MNNCLKTKFRYTENVPSFLEDYLKTEKMERLCYVGMNCGVEYTSFPVFRNILPYSRYMHSLGCALIVWNFTHDEKQTLAALFHDIATPVFAHSIDFMNKDYLKQESTEEKTGEFIQNSRDIMELLNKQGILLSEVNDYHLYPIADNDAPKLSSDRLEYTFGNALNFGFASDKKLEDIYRNISVSFNEEKENELVFNDLKQAKEFGLLTLKCSHIYTSDEDRYAMQRIAELMKRAIEMGVIEYSDLYTTEEEVIQKIKKNEILSKDWEEYGSLDTVMIKAHKDSRIIPAKKRTIDPYVKGRGRLSKLDEDYKEKLMEYRNISFDYPVYGFRKRV